MSDYDYNFTSYDADIQNLIRGAERRLEKNIQRRMSEEVFHQVSVREGGFVSNMHNKTQAQLNQSRVEFMRREAQRMLDAALELELRNIEKQAVREVVREDAEVGTCYVFQKRWSSGKEYTYYCFKADNNRWYNTSKMGPNNCSLEQFLEWMYSDGEVLSVWIVTEMEQVL